MQTRIKRENQELESKDATMVVRQACLGKVSVKKRSKINKTPRRALPWWYSG